MRNLFNDGLCKKYGPLDSAIPLGDNPQESVSQALLRLPAELRLPVVLCDMAGLSYDEIAEILACPAATVRSRIIAAGPVAGPA